MNVKNGMIATFIVALQLTTYIAGAVMNEDFWTLKEKTNEGADFELRFTDLKDVLTGVPHVSEKKSSEIVFLPFGLFFSDSSRLPALVPLLLVPG